MLESEDLGCPALPSDQFADPTHLGIAGGSVEDFPENPISNAWVGVLVQEPIAESTGDGHGTKEPLVRYISQEPGNLFIG
jgi:hypothetical protein